MEEQQHSQGHNYSNTTMPSAEAKDCKFTDFMGKKEENSQDDVSMVNLEMVDKHEGTELKEKHTLLEELRRTRSSSSSSSDEEVEEGGETKKRRTKGLKDKIKEKISHEKGEECIDQKDTYVTIEEGNAKVENGETTNSEQKKGFLEKIKEKLPGQHKKTEEGTAIPPNQEDFTGGEIKEKKGIFDKIKEKLPGHCKNEEEPKEKDN